MFERQINTESVSRLMTIVQVLAVVISQIFCLNFIVKFVVKFTFEYELLLVKCKFHDFLFAIFFEDSLDILKMLCSGVEQELIFREIITFIALNFLVDIEENICLNDVEVSGFDYFKLSIIGIVAENGHEL